MNQNSSVVKLFSGVIVSFSLVLAGCAPMEAGLTPQQQALRTGASFQPDPDYSPRARTAETVVTGAAAGAVLGAVLGIGVAALGGGRNYTQAALIGGGVGALAGGAGGAVVDRNNQNEQARQTALVESINRAKSDASSFRSYAVNAQQAVQQGRQRIAQLDSQFRSGQLSAAQFRNEAISYQRDLQSMQSLLTNVSRSQQGMNTAANISDTQFADSASSMGESLSQLQAAHANMARALAVVPG